MFVMSSGTYVEVKIALNELFSSLLQKMAVRLYLTAIFLPIGILNRWVVLTGGGRTLFAGTTNFLIIWLKGRCEVAIKSSTHNTYTAYNYDPDND